MRIDAASHRYRRQTGRGAAAALCALALAACSERPVADSPPGLGPEERARYEACLERNMAVAMAWEAIEAQCLSEATGAGAPRLPEPQ